MNVANLGRVYIIISPTYKVYIGSTKNSLNERFLKYYSLNCKKQRKLYYSLKKHGSKNHEFYEIWKGSIENMYMMEAKLGRFFNVLDSKKGLNCKLPKESDMYSCLSLETKIKLSKINLGRKQSDETKKKRSISNKGQIVSIEHRIKISKANKGRIMSIEAREKMSISKKGKSLSLEHKQKIGNSCNKPIIQLTLNGEFIKEWNSIKNAALYVGIDRSGITSCCLNKQLTAGGYKWKYKTK